MHVDPVTLVLFFSLWAMTSAAVVVSRLPTIKTNFIASFLLFVLPFTTLLWAAFYARSGGSSALVSTAVCALPAAGTSLYMRLLLRQGHEIFGIGLPPVACPGPYVRRWIVSAIAGTSLAIGWARVWCYPDGLVVSLAKSQGLEWYVHWLLATLSGCATTMLWWQALQRTSVCLLYTSPSPRD